MSGLVACAFDAAESLAQPAAVESPGIPLPLERGDVSAELIRQREPFASFTDAGEVPVALLLDSSPSALEGEELFMPDVRQSLPRTAARADLHAAVEADVVDDIDPGERQVGIGSVTVPPAAGAAAQGAVSADTSRVPAEGARTRQCEFG